MAFRVLLDACVLVPYQLCDLLLRLAEEDMYEVLWSDEILNEVERTLIGKLGRTPEQAARRIGHMRAAFPLAVVDNYEDLTPVMTNHPKDRHVLAAAIRGNAALVVTANDKDFPISALERYDIEAVRPDVFLQYQLDLDTDRVVRCIARQRNEYSRPALTFDDFYQTLHGTAPVFAERARAAEQERLDLSAPLPLEIVDADAAMQAFFPDDNPTPETPLGAAFLWWQALLNRDTHLNALRSLSSNPSDWGDYRNARDSLTGWAMMQNVHYNEEAPEHIAYVKFMRDSGFSMKAFEGAAITEYQIVVVLRCTDGWWRVWGLAENFVPTAGRILRGET